MKQLLVLSLITLSAVFSNIQAEDKAKAPHGGRLIEVGEQQLEFFVTPERMVEVRFLDRDLQTVSQAGATLQVVAQAKSGSQKLDLVLKENVYVSEQALPADEPYNVVLRVKATEGSSYENLRLVYNTVICAGCQLPEYGCTCEGH
jgi:hypothetical protein